MRGHQLSHHTIHSLIHSANAGEALKRSHAYRATPKLIHATNEYRFLFCYQFLCRSRNNERVQWHDWSCHHVPGAVYHVALCAASKTLRVLLMLKFDANARFTVKGNQNNPIKMISVLNFRFIFYRKLRFSVVGIRISCDVKG